MRGIRALAKATAIAVVAATAAVVPAVAPQPASASTPALRHVVSIVLENTTWEGVNSSAGRAAMPYLHSLESQGVQLNNMYGVSHASLTNYIAMTSGNPPNVKTKADCFSYDCVYEAPDDTNIGDQLEGAGFSWKGYMESMPAPCAHGTEGATDPYQVGYATRHNPFMYYRSIVSDQTRCDSHVLPLAPALSTDLTNNTLPNYSLIVPNTCNDAHDLGTNCGLDDADLWLSTHVPAILANTQFQTDGLLLITFDESAFSDTRGCCSNAAGGKIHTLAISPFIQRPGTSTPVNYSLYSVLRTVEDAFGLSCLRLACDAGTVPLGDDVFGAPTDDFNLSAPPVGLRAGTSAGVTLRVPVTNGSAQSVSLSATTNVSGLSVSFVPSTVTSGGSTRLVVSTTLAVLPQNTAINVVATSGAVQRALGVPVDVVLANKFPNQVQNGNFEDLSALSAWKFNVHNPPTFSGAGFVGASALHLHNNQAIRQTVAVSPFANTLTLSWRSSCNNVKSWFQATVRDLMAKVTTPVVAKTCATNNGWSTVTVSAVAWRGHNVLINIGSHKAPYTAAVVDSDVDEVFFA